MLVSGSLHADFSARTGAPVNEAPAVTSSPAGDRQGHFSVISTIRPGSLAAAYHAMRGQAEGGAAGQGAILSGLGIPAALDAYGEILETGTDDAG